MMGWCVRLKIGDIIKSRREELGLSQDDLAKKMGYKSRSSINKIENGTTRINQDKIEMFADALDTTPSVLMGWDIKKTDIGYTINDGKDEMKIELIDATKDLTDKQIRQLISYAKFIIQERSGDEKENKD
jgi:transcriptional regulator with XRE-family HTH domain